MALNVNTGIVQNGLISYLDAGNIRSYPGFGTYWYDISGNNFTAIGQSGASYQNSNFSPSILYNGTPSGYHTLPLLSTATTNITMSVWANITSLSSRGCFFVNGNSNGYAVGIGSQYFENYGNEIIGLFPVVRWISTGINYGLGWKNITLVINSSSVPSIYFNGQLLGTYTGSNPLTPTTSAYVGREIFDGLQSPNRAFNGNIGQVLFYNRALSAAEVLQNYNATKQRYIYNQPINSNGLLLGLDFSDNLTYTGLGNTVFDLSPNVYKGTLTNGPKFTNDRNGGIIFDGVDDQISFAGNLTNITYDNFSFEFVAKPSATITTSAESTSGIAGATGKRYIIEPTNESGNGGFGVALGTNAVECIEHGGSYLPVLLSYSANLSDVNHYCVVVNNKRSKLYINGEYIKDGLQSPRPNSVARNTATLGFMYYGNYAGTLYEYNFYNRVLSANEIKSSFEQSRGKFGIKNNRDKSGLLLDLDFSNRVCYPGTGNTAFDLSGNNYNGTLNSSPTFSRDQGGNFQFTGSQTITIPTSGPLILTKNDNYSLNFWVYANSTQASNTPSILEYSNINSYAFAIRFTITNGTIEAKAYDGVNPINPSCDAVIEFNKWNHVCAVYNWSRNMIQLYLNGKIARILNLESYTFGTINNLGDIGIANRGNFSGRIGELKIYKRALSSSEINNLYLASKDRFFVDSQDIRDGLILDLDANNVDSYPGGNTWFDTSGSGLTTILSNTPSFIRGTASKLFFGSGSYGSVPYTITSSPITVFVWFNSRSYSSASFLGGLISNYDNATNGFDIRKQGANLLLSLVTDAAVGDINVIDTVTDNTWYNIAFTYNGASLISYTNGLSIATTALTGTRRNGTRISLATSAYDFPTRLYACDISQVKIYNRALSASEINTLFQNTRSRYGI